MKRINVIGTTGSGKSTFSKALSCALNIPYVQLDALFWKPNWQESTDEEFLPKVAKAAAEEHWVMDGNFSRTTDIKWQRADTVVWLDFGYLITFKQLLFRTLSRAISKHELWPGTGNRESFRKSFFHKSSILLWFFQNYRRNRRKYLAVMESEQYSHITFIHLTNPQEAREFIEETQDEFCRQNAARDATV